VELCRQYKLVV